MRPEGVPPSPAAAPAPRFAGLFYERFFMGEVGMSELVGYCIGNARGEFLAYFDMRPDLRLLGWVASPDVVKVFPHPQEARRMIRVLRLIDEAVPVELFDAGDRWVVVWPDYFNPPMTT